MKTKKKNQIIQKIIMKKIQIKITKKKKKKMKKMKKEKMKKVKKKKKKRKNIIFQIKKMKQKINQYHIIIKITYQKIQ